jgi:predicted secreted Zn-dependent protease
MNNKETLSNSKIEYDEDGSPKISLYRLFRVFKNNVNTKLERIEDDVKTTKEYTNISIDEMVSNLEKLIDGLNLSNNNDKLKMLEERNNELERINKLLNEENDAYEDFIRKALEDAKIELKEEKQKEEITVKS